MIEFILIEMKIMIILLFADLIKEYEKYDNNYIDDSDCEDCCESEYIYGLRYKYKYCYVCEYKLKKEFVKEKKKEKKN